MIKKFSEFIEEGMWGSALKRSNTGKERKDDEANRIQEFIDNQPESSSIYITDGNVINSKSYIIISDTDLVDGKLPFKFGRVDKDFICRNCPSLTSLEGSPQEVGGNFSCQECTSLKSLEGVPQKVGGNFDCSCISGLKSLKGCPKYIGGDFYFYSTGIYEIDDFPDEVGGNVELSGCFYLNSFKGLPNKINGDLDITYCDVESLEGLPTDVNGYVYYENLTLNNKPVSVSDITEIYPELSKHLKTSKYNW